MTANIQEVSGVEECRALWEQFSPKSRAWDNWELMFAFHDVERYTFNFLVLEQEGAAVGLVPLVRETMENKFEMFGGSYPENRVLWIDIEHFPLVFEALPEKTSLFDLSGKWVAELLARYPQFEANFVEEDHQYFLTPSKFDYDFDNHLTATFSADRRKGFLKDVQKVRSAATELRWSEDDESELFIDLNVKSFGEESDYNNDAGKAELHRVVKTLQSLGMLRTLTIAIDGVRQAASMSARYGDDWIVLYSSSNNKINNLGKLLTVETIQEACRQRIKEVNYMTGMAWKAAWHMETLSCRSFRKPARALQN